MLLKDLGAAAVLLLLCAQCLHGSALPAVSSYEFTAYRMQQYNLAQQKRGKFTESPPVVERVMLSDINPSTVPNYRCLCADGIN